MSLSQLKNTRNIDVKNDIHAIVLKALCFYFLIQLGVFFLVSEEIRFHIFVHHSEDGCSFSRERGSTRVQILLLLSSASDSSLSSSAPCQLQSTGRMNVKCDGDTGCSSAAGHLVNLLLDGLSFSPDLIT